MALAFYNTLTKKIEEFKPILAGKASIYHCGPTVYNYAHVGNFRSFIFADTLRRALELSGFAVKQTINITDIGHLTGDGDDGDDKMVKALKREGKEMTLAAMREVANFYKDAFVADLKTLRILMPHEMPFASDNIVEDIEIIELLEKKGFAYKISDGMYFDTKKMKDYGKLAGPYIEAEGELESRIGANSEKHSPRDFALWKFSDNEKIGYPSPWGTGFPGWHIECSAMARKFLGQPFDIHTGGIDHIPVHHTNEIAQSEAAYGEPLAHVWMHNGFVNIDGEKISKSLGNDIYLADVAKIARPESYRLWLLMAHYRSPINFTYDALRAADTALTTLYEAFVALPEADGTVDENYKVAFIAAIENDLDTPRAIATLFGAFKDENLDGATKRATILFFDQVLGLGFGQLPKIEIPESVTALAADRDTARTNKDFKKADELRMKIEAEGFIVRDAKEGSQIVPARLSPLS
ncbi:MAG: cysteine--tRNA ligase [Candidatus Pacebacteria bacterium]|nr:cysteine--tRNA ligase [Candidatus Paceibacterota bacterium]MBP9851764.1 cysteine--tRNA ligase [Candidatus Paceibacterota bacterium]